MTLHVFIADMINVKIL